MKLGQALLLSDVSTRFLQDPRRWLISDHPRRSKVLPTASGQVADAFVHKEPESLPTS